mmetsp:Transcript_19563/g.32652  ORF Transcript_19563/g.32652 Transcript_19563/m.32652 type:complete len:98 (-) Transcript_19563:1952-2245(-)
MSLRNVRENLAIMRRENEFWFTIDSKSVGFSARGGLSLTVCHGVVERVLIQVGPCKAALMPCWCWLGPVASSKRVVGFLQKQNNLGASKSTVCSCLH